jgi:hypothetical protein
VLHEFLAEQVLQPLDFVVRTLAMFELIFMTMPSSVATVIS